MTKLIGLIAEDRSDVAVINEILLKYLSNNQFSIKSFVGKGCGKIKRKCIAWSRYFIRRGCEHLIIVHDLDEKVETELRRELEEITSRTTFEKKVVVIPVKELEAWLITDEDAIKNTFKISTKLNCKKNTEKIENPKEYLRDLVWKRVKKRYLNNNHNVRIANLCKVDNLKRCKSFLYLDTYINTYLV